VRTAEGLEAALAEFDRRVGLEHVRAFHLLSPGLADRVRPVPVGVRT